MSLFTRLEIQLYSRCKKTLYGEGEMGHVHWTQVKYEWLHICWSSPRNCSFINIYIVHLLLPVPPTLYTMQIYVLLCITIVFPLKPSI